MSKHSDTEPDANQPLKIAFVFDDSLDSYDGVARQVKTLGCWLSDHGHEVSYLVGQTKLKQWAGGTIYSLARNIGVSFNRNRLSIPLPANRLRIKKLLVSQNFDVLHVQMPYSPFMAQRVIKYAGPQTAVIGTFHILPAGLLAAWGSKFLRLVYGQSLQRFDQVVSVSPPAAAFAKQVFDLQSEVVPNTIDMQKFTVAKTTKGKSPRIIFLGRLVQRKGSLELLKAFSLLHPKYPEVRLTIGGDGPLRPKLERFVKQHNLDKTVDFLGFVDESDKASLLSSAKIACFPSLYGESFGLVLIEAMAAGAEVVIGGDNPGYRSVLGERPQLLIKPRQTEEFAKHLETLLTDQRLAERLHDWQQKVIKHYDVKTIGPRILEIYRQAIVKRSKNGHN